MTAGSGIMAAGQERLHQERLQESAQETVMVRQPFTVGRVSFCLLPLLALALWIVALSSLATAGGTATAAAPARITVPVPAAAKSSNVVMLELSVAVLRKSGHLGGVVSIKSATGASIEVGSFSVAGDAQSYQFNVTRALGREPSGTAEVEVALIDRGGGAVPSNAALSIGRAEIVAR